MPIQVSATLAVPGNAVNITVNGAFILPYEVALSASWNTSFAVSAKGLASFLVTFGTPAPAGGGTLDYSVYNAVIVPPPPVSPAGGAVTSNLSDYLTETRRLLRDSNGTLYTDTDLTSFINRAIRLRDLDLGMNRLRIAFTLTAGQFDYPIATVTTTGVVLDGNANAIPQDILSIIVIPLGPATSSIRYPLARWPYTKLAFLLSTSFPTYPVVYAMYGASTIFIAPPPAQAYPAEFDFICYSPNLVNAGDTDMMPYPWTEPVTYMAASLAKVQVQRFDEAQGFGEMYAKAMNRVRGRARSIAVSNPWSDLPRK